MAFSVIKDFYHRPTVRTTEVTFHQLKASLPLFDPNRGGLFLDIACHDGTKTLLLQRRIAAQLTVGTDFEGDALSSAHRMGIACAAIDLNRKLPLPFPAGSFDCIHAGEIIEHLFSPDLLLGEISRLLKPDGYAVITTPNLASWRNRIVLCLGWQPFNTEVSTSFFVGNPRTERGLLAGHIRVFTFRALSELAGLYGLSIQKMIGCSLGRPASLFTRLMAVIDRLVEIVFPEMCDDLMIRVCKTPGSSGTGSPTRP
jgi:SAM-dependent methyltransferase